MVESVRFGAADRFLLLVDRELRRAGLAGFQAVLAVELDGALTEARRKALAGALEDLLDEEPRGRARLGRWLGLGPLRLGPGRGRGAALRERTDEGGDLVALAVERLEAPLDPRVDPLVDLEVRAPASASAHATTRLVLRWWHPVMDERGAELLLLEASRRVTEGSNAAPPPPPLPSPTRGMRLRKRWLAFRAARRRLEELTKRPPFLLPRSPGSNESHSRADASWRVESTTLDPASTARFLAACDSQFGPRGEGLAQAGLLFRALADLAPEDAELALPVSIQLRPPRARGPWSGNALSFLWFAVESRLANDPGRLAEHLRVTARAKVAAGEEREAAALLEMGRLLPLPLYRRELARADGTTRFSAGLSTLGELLGGARGLFGLPLRDAVALTAFPEPPGAGVVFSRAAGALRIATLHAPSRVEPAAAGRLHERLVTRARELAG